jgi:hypothetical protein
MSPAMHTPVGITREAEYLKTGRKHTHFQH